MSVFCGFWRAYLGCVVSVVACLMLAYYWWDTGSRWAIIMAFIAGNRLAALASEIDRHYNDKPARPSEHERDRHKNP